MKKNPISKLTTNRNDTAARDKLYEHALCLLHKQEGFSIRPLVILCIGSDRYTGDALGPLIGSHLREHVDCIVFGSLECPVHAGNLVETIAIINHQYHHPIIIAIDACLGKSNEIGNIEIWEGGLQAGIAVGNNLPSVGHISIIGVVNAGGQIGYLDLQSTPLSIVMKLSKIIGGALENVINAISNEKDSIIAMG